MAYYSRYRRRYRRAYGRYRRYGRYYGRYRRASYTRKYVNGSSRSSIRLKVPVTFVSSFTQAAATTADPNPGTDVQLVAHPFYRSNVASSPLTSPLYRNYAALYDEVKCVGVKARISVVDSVGTASIPTLRIYTSWDRKQCLHDFLPTLPQLQTYSTSRVVTAVNNSVAKIDRSIWASDIMERAQWHDCSVSQVGTTGVYYDPGFEKNDDNCSFFAPALFLAFQVLGNNQQISINTSIELTYYLSFRNPKYGATTGGGAKSGGDVQVRSVAALPDGPLDPTLVADEDIEDDDFVDAEPLDFHDDAAALAEIARIEAERASASTAVKSTPVVVQKAGKAARASSKNK